MIKTFFVNTGFPFKHILDCDIIYMQKYGDMLGLTYSELNFVIFHLLIPCTFFGLSLLAIFSLYAKERKTKLVLKTITWSVIGIFLVLGLLVFNELFAWHMFADLSNLPPIKKIL